MQWRFDNTFVRDLNWLGVSIDPVPVARPVLVELNTELAVELDLDPEWLRSPEGVAVLAGNAVAPGSQPIAQGYSGHQFGQFSPVLGDGRAHLLGEVVDVHGARRDIALKGSGRTPFSRGGDGRAALGPVLREFLLGEAMHSLGVPTTRALAAVTTGEPVHRETALPGAVLTRVAASHLRVGTVELVRSQGSREQVADLLEFVRARHYPDLPPGRPLELLSAVVERQADLVAHWMSLGFIHGVMNTDNMTLSGETIDYGPCAFMEHYDPDTVFSSIDRGGRYRYQAQPVIATWNLARLAEALLALAEGDPNEAVADVTERVHAFQTRYDESLLAHYRAKLALPQSVEAAAAAALVQDLLRVMHEESLDYTRTFRDLAQHLRSRPATLEDPPALVDWLVRWRTAMGSPGPDAASRAADAMDAVNPLYIPRNHLVEDALDAAAEVDLRPFEELLDVVRSPFVERPGAERFAQPAPKAFTERYVTYCGT